MPETINTPTQNEQQDRSEPAAPAEAKTQVQEVQLPEAPADSGSASAGQLDILLDMGIPISVVLGQTQIPIRRPCSLDPARWSNSRNPSKPRPICTLKDSKSEADVVVSRTGSPVPSRRSWRGHAGRSVRGKDLMSTSSEMNHKFKS
jgi:hypothetical protein